MRRNLIGSPLGASSTVAPPLSDDVLDYATAPAGASGERELRPPAYVSSAAGRVALPRDPTTDVMMRSAERHPSTPTLAEVVRRAADACDPEGVEDGVWALVERLEDRDEPVTALADVGEELAEASGAIDPEDEDPAVVMTVALATYLAYRRDEMGSPDEQLLRLAARAEFDGNPPTPVSDWLSARGVKL
jgi:hypothetical protein